MGLVHSHNLLTEPVTLNRMRYVCQRNSKLPPQVQKFNVELLANDLNKLGFNIRLTDQRGNRLSNEKICNEIYKSRPSVEGICMANNNQVSGAKVTELVHYFNKHFGTNIALTENPMDPDSKRRAIPDLCDDLYMVQDKINRKLADNADAVKRSLREQIEQLKLQQQVLDESFGRHLNLLRANHPEAGTDMDKIRDRVNASAAIRERLVGEMGRQTQFATQMLGDLESQLDSRFYPNIRHVDTVLKQYYNRPFDGTVGTVGMQINNLLSGVKGLAGGLETYNSCMSRLGLTLDDLKKDNFEQLLAQAVEKGKVDGTIPGEVNVCYEKLRNQQEIYLRQLDSDAALKSLGKEMGVSTDGGIILGGGAREPDRQSFWVDADASESAFVY